MININLLPKDMRRTRTLDYWKIGAGAVAGVSLITMIGLQLSVNGTLAALNRDIATNQSELAVRQKDVAERDQLRARKTELEAIARVAETLQAGKTSWSGDLARFVRQLPASSGQSIALNSLSMRSLDATAQQGALANGLYDRKTVAKEVQLQGRTRSSDSLVGLVNAFEQSPDFGVQFQSAQRDEETGDYTFNVTVGLVAPAQPAAAPDPAQPGSQTTGQAPSAPTTAASAGGTR